MAQINQTAIEYTIFTTESECDYIYQNCLTETIKNAMYEVSGVDYCVRHNNNFVIGCDDINTTSNQLATVYYKVIHKHKLIAKLQGI